ncbi:MAG: hypothetical protein U1E36_09190, partial [Rickettsiales bacterium]
MPKAGHLDRKIAASLVDIFKPLIVSFFEHNGFQRRLETGKLVLPEEENRITPEKRALLTQHGNTPEAALGIFMADFLALKPYPYGNWMTLNTFLVEFCRSDKVKDIFHGNGFDLRRVDKELLSRIRENASNAASS